MVKAYDNSIRLVREELARRIALSTRKDRNIIRNFSPNFEYKVGDYVRATYEDGIDYEAKLISVNQDSETCILRYIGYGNEQEMALSNLIPSWGKKARRLQYAMAKMSKDTDHISNNQNCGKASKSINSTLHFKTCPPPPPIPPMLSSTHNSEDSEHLSAMLMSWYMSGYYTGVYQGIQMGKSTQKNMKK